MNQSDREIDQSYVFSPPRGVIQNVRFRVLADGVMEITYDLVSDDDDAVFEVQLGVSAAGRGEVPATNVKGDVGHGVRPGRNRRITWDYDVAAPDVGALRFTVIAEAGRGRPSVGGLQISSTPSGAVVLLDGINRGVTPLTLHAVSPGPHELRMQKGGVEVRRDVTVVAGERQQVDIPLSVLRRRQQWHLTTSWFTSLEPLPGVGHQPMGGVVAVGRRVGNGVEVGLEASLAQWTQRSHAEQITRPASSSFLRDSVLSLTVGREVNLWEGVRVIPLVGGGVARLQTHRFAYTLSAGTSPYVLEITDSRDAPALTLGVDLRIVLWRRLHGMASYRLHAIPDSPAVESRRTTLHHRPAMGLQFLFGE